MGKHWIAWLAALTVAGCVSLQLQAPHVTVADIDLVDATLLEQRFALKLRVQNPNDADIAIRGLNVDVEVNGQHFARGVSDQAVTLPRFGEAVLEVNAVSDLGSLWRQIMALRKGGRQGLEYRISGRLAMGGVGEVPFESRGELKLPDVPHRSPARPGST